jgi:hypothetical protein
MKNPFVRIVRPHTIEHNGQKWTSTHIGPNWRYVWPIEELLARTDFPPDVQERLKELNPFGKEEGETCPGWPDDSAGNIA